jgi:hypothetical protein
MKRSLLACVVTGLACVGCDPFATAFVLEKPAAPERAPETTPVTRKEKPITADQISEQNAHDKVKGLALELDRDEQGGLRIDTEVEVPGGK